MLVLWATLPIVAVLTRRAARWFARGITTPERCLFVGSDESYERRRAKLPEGDARAKLVGRMSLSGTANDAPGADDATTLRHLIDNLSVHRVIIEPNEAFPQITLDFVREAKATSVGVSLLPRILEVVGATIEIDDVDSLTLLGVRRFGLSRSSRMLKRGFDIVGATLGLIAMAPFIAVVAVLIKLDSSGPVLLRQRRVGRDCAAFETLQFRTSVVGAEQRATRIGRLLHRTSLRELPQLMNVLRGEMSLVGPRPLMLDEDTQITGLDRQGLVLKPGMTGHWQTRRIIGRSPLGNDQAGLRLLRRMVGLDRCQDPAANGSVHARAAIDVERGRGGHYGVQPRLDRRDRL